MASNCEAFITNVRGWCVEHGFVLKLENEILLVGQLGNPAGLGSHIDRYIVREDAKVNDLTPNHSLLLLSREEANRGQNHFGDSSAWQSNNRVARTNSLAIRFSLQRSTGYTPMTSCSSCKSRSGRSDSSAIPSGHQT